MKRRTVLKLSAVAAAGMFAGSLPIGQVASAAPAGARLDPRLSELFDARPDLPQQVVVTFRQSGPPTRTQVDALRALGIDTGVLMRALPIAGVVATAAQVEQLSAREDVVSLFHNAELTYHNNDSREITGAARAVDHPGDFGRTTPFSGRGVTVVVNDSGIDATQPDVKFGPHVIENVLAPQNILAELAGEGIVPISYLEGVPNTDIGSGHGTHCAGTVGGTGAMSDGYYRGVAPGAKLVGYGSGAVLFILDAVGGLDYAAVNQFRFADPIRVTSNSWGSSGAFDPTDPVNVASYELYKRGIVSCFAAGNDGPGEDTHNPYAQAPWVISVGAGRKDGRIADFSSRGQRGESGAFTMPDGTSWVYVNAPDVVAPGVDVVSVRDSLGVLPILAAQEDTANLSPDQLAFYTQMSGTSMATPHVAGVVALLLEADPDLGPDEVRDILQRTATNMSGRLPWEAGAGYVNAYAAVADASGTRDGWGATVNERRTFNASAVLLPGRTEPFSFMFSPVGTTGEQTFAVGADVAWVSVRATIAANTLALVLIDPDGVRYGSSIALPELGDTVSTGAPGKAGTWTVTARGIGSVSGTGLDPLEVTNGYALPGEVSGEISLLESGGFTGLTDISGHPGEKAIEYAVANRLVDSERNGRFRPDADLTRGALAQFLVMGQSIRQALPFSGGSSFSDVRADADLAPFAEAVGTAGGALPDAAQSQDPVVQPRSGAFRPGDAVSRADLAYSLVQSLGVQEEVRGFSGSLTAFYDGRRIPIEDPGSVGSVHPGYVQRALDDGLLNARFTVTQGPFDLQPVVHAFFDGGRSVSRAGFAVASGRFLQSYL